jgi:integrase
LRRCAPVGRLRTLRISFGPVLSAHRPIRPRLRRAFDRATIDAGIGDDWSPDSLRHTAASLLSHAGVALEDIADQLGHKDTRMASLYYRHRVRLTVSAGLQMEGVINR